MTSEIKTRIAAINSGIIPEGYKKTKVGIVPVEWDRYKLSDISDELTEKAGNNPYETLSISAGIGFVNQANKFGKELSGKQYEKYIVLHKGDFSYNKGNSKKYPQGCIYQLKDRDEAAVPNVFESFRLYKGINDYYEQLFVSGFLNRQLFAKINHGVRDDGLLNLKSEDFYSCYVPFPPLPEQQKIAEILSAQDKLIELQEKKIEQLKELKKAYLQKMFPQKGSKYPELRFKGFTDPWEQRKLGEICEQLKDTIDPQLTPDTKYFEYSMPAFDDDSEPDIVSGYEMNSIRKVINAPCLLINKLNVRKRRIWLVESPENNAVCSAEFVPVTSEISSLYFLKYIVMKDDFTAYLEDCSSGSSNSQKRVTPDVIMKATILIPTIAEQIQIGTFFSNLDHLITLHQRKSEQEKQKKKALMQLLLTGKVRCV